MTRHKVTNLAEVCFQLIENAAIAGVRCPMSRPYGPLDSEGVSRLVTDGRIRVEIFRQNWRVITLLTGPHAGKSTKAAPGGGMPYRTLGGFRRGFA